MSGRITLVSASSTSATNTAGFPADEPLDERGAGWAAQARGRLTHTTRVYSSPALSCRQTAAALDLTAATEPLLRDWDLGRWRGRTLEDVAVAEPDAVRTWLTVAEAAPHGGEALTALLTRAAEWLAAAPAGERIVAITHPGVIRAAVLAVLDAPPGGFWRLDLPPLTTTVLVGGPGRWTIRAMGQHLVPRPAR